MTIMYDVLDDVKTLLTGAQWNATGAGGNVPSTRIVYDTRVQGLETSSDEIVIYPLDEIIKPFQLHGDHYFHIQPVNIDIRTYTDITRHKQVVKEVNRIMKNNIRRGTFLQINVRGGRNYNEDYRNMFRHVVRIEYWDNQPFTFV